MDVPASATQSAVVVAIPEVEPFVSGHRRSLDRAAAWGVPAHVTVLYPFLAPESLTPSAVSTLEAAVATVPAFACTFSRVDWFDDAAAWLRPDPPAWDSFMALTRAVWRAFPGHPPYDGAFGDDIAPHLTIGESQLATVEAVRAAAAEVCTHLPMTVLVREAVLIAGREAPGSWGVVRRLTLG